MRTLQIGRNTYSRTIAGETQRAAACGDIRKLYQMLESISHKPVKLGEILLEQDGSFIPDQARRLYC